MRRELLVSYAIVGLGLLSGLLVGGVLTDAESALLGWLLGAGMGLTAGAVVAAILAGVPLAGRRREAAASRGGQRAPDPLAHLRLPGAADDPAEADAGSPGEDGTAGIAGLGRGGNGRAL